MAGRYACTSAIDGRRIEDSLTEKKDSIFWASYTYETEEGIVLMFSDIGNKLFLSQIKQKGQPIVVTYMETTDTGIQFLVPNVMTAGPAIDNLSRQNAVTARLLQSGRVSLTGAVESVTAFLSKNDRSMFMAALTCVKK